MNLFKISQELIEQLGQFEDSQEEDILNQLEITKENLDNKVISYDFVINDLKGKESVISEQIKRLQAYKKSLQNKQSLLKKALLQVVLLFGEDRKMTKAQKEKGLSRAGKKLEIVNENGRVLLSESITQKTIYDTLDASDKSVLYTVKVDGEALKKLSSEEYSIVKTEENTAAAEVLRYDEVSSLRIK
jgi:hypothetical protein